MHAFLYSSIGSLTEQSNVRVGGQGTAAPYQRNRLAQARSVLLMVGRGSTSPAEASAKADLSRRSLGKGGLVPPKPGQRRTTPPSLQGREKWAGCVNPRPTSGTSWRKREAPPDGVAKALTRTIAKRYHSSPQNQKLPSPFASFSSFTPLVVLPKLFINRRKGPWPNALRRRL